MHIDSIEIRSVESGNYLIEGYINKFNTRSKFMRFYEQIDKRAFDRTLAKGHNIFAMYNHNSDKILGSTKSGSLTLSTDDIGLRFSLQINPNVSYAKDVYELVKSGDVEGCSFGFIALEEQWDIQDDDSELRTILDLELIECTITPFPAYEESEATAKRSYQQHENVVEEQRKQLVEQEQIHIELELLK